METFKITGEYIELIALLKATGIAETRNGEIETRKRAKLIPGDVIRVFEYEISIA
jgi:ribosome-associated protein